MRPPRSAPTITTVVSFRWPGNPAWRCAHRRSLTCSRCSGRLPSRMRAALYHLVSLAWFFAPAWCANMAPPFVRYWRGWNRPVSRRWLGSHKTVVGVLAGVLTGVATTAVQAHARVPLAMLADYAEWPWLGLAFGGGAMAGDMLKSFLKRRLGIPPGARWIPFDQV